MTSFVMIDRWDREDLASVAGLRSLVSARELLAEVDPGGSEALDAVFYLLLKASPELAEVPEGLELAGAVVAAVVELDSVQRLRRSTMGDPFGAAMAAAGLAPALAEMFRRAPDMGTMAAAGDVGEVAEGLAEGVEDEIEAAAAWGVEPGSLQHLPVAERLALARALDSQRVRAIADLFGRLRSAAFAQPAVAEGGWGEVCDLELGADLARVVGSEWLGLVEAGLEDVFFARLANGELLQVETTAEDELGRGGIILCVDGSGTMNLPLQGYTREMWAQALKLLLVRQAQRQGRPLHVIDFGARGEYQHVAFESPGDFAPDRVLATAGAFYGRGTDFETPLRLALKLTAGSPGMGADVVFVSDGDCWVSDAFLARYEEQATLLGVRTWGVLVAARGGFPFTKRVWTVADLTGGPEVGDLLARMS